MSVRILIFVILGAIVQMGCSARFADEESFAAASLGFAEAGPESEPRHLVGQPYSANGRLYRPRHQPQYNAIGMATWYGDALDGRTTANGEKFDSQNLFAAHPTLPLPSYVEITNLENGRSLTARVNARQPVARDALINVSERLAEHLGFRKQGRARVAVRFLSPAPIRRYSHYR